MEQRNLVLPRLLPIQQERPPQETIPQTRLERDRIKAVVQSYVAELKPVPPMPIHDLRMHADTVVESAALQEKYRDYVAVLLNNEAWRDTLAGIPYERRLLMLPKCLRVEAKCPAPFDEFGLLCKHCGLCSIQDLQDEAERLGYAVLCAEGSAIVMAIIESASYIGGARSQLWRQMQADVFGIPVRRTSVDEGPAYGAALLAGVTAGHFKSVDDAVSVVRLRSEVAEPNPESARLYSRYLRIYRDLYPATAAAMGQLSDLA